MIKRKFVVCSILTMLILLNLTTALTIADGYSDSKQSRINSSEKQWTIMFYDDADFYMAGDPLDSFASEAFSSGNINVLVLQDTEHGPATLWYIDENHSKIPLKEMGEVNMGNYTTLEDFVAFGKNNFSAQRYMIFFYDHGDGWLGACCDNNSGNDWLTMDEMQHALTEAGGVDVVCFSAPCLMGAIESAYELRNCTEIYIGSEELSGYIYWFYAIGDIYTVLNENTNISNIDLGKKIIESIGNNLHTLSRKDQRGVTMSAIDTSKMGNVASSIDQLAQDLAVNAERNHVRIKLIRALTQPFANSKFNFLIKGSILDAYDFAKNCFTFYFFNKAIKTSAKQVMENIDEAVIANLMGISHPRAHGLTIYFPPNYSRYNNKYTTSELDFTNDTQWDEFLEMYLS
jgi:hypothetical protein